MSRYSSFKSDIVNGFKGPFETETQVPSDSESGFDSDAIGVCNTADVDRGNMWSRLGRQDLAIPHSSTEPSRIFVTGPTSPPLPPCAEPARLFGFDHLAPTPHLPPHDNLRQPLELPQTDSRRGLPQPSANPSLHSPAFATPLRLTYHKGSPQRTSASMSIQWVVDARKLSSKDTVIVSPSFELPFVSSTSFRIMLRPEQVSLQASGLSFQKSRGVGTVQLKCVSEFPEEVGPLELRWMVGQGPLGEQQVHDFSQCGVCSVPQVWNFRDAVDATTRSFIVWLEVSGLR